MVLRIEQVSGDSQAVFVLGGRISSPDVQALKAHIADWRTPVAFDLSQVRLVDLDAVRFLAAAERHGIELRHTPPYVHEWIVLERSRLTELE